MAKSIICPNPKCGRTFAKLLGDRTLDIKRQKQQITVTGKDCQIIATCGWCNEKNVLFVEEGKFNEEGIEFRDIIEKPDDEELSKEEKAKREEEQRQEDEKKKRALEGKGDDDDDDNQDPPTPES